MRHFIKELESLRVRMEARVVDIQEEVADADAEIRGVLSVRCVAKVLANKKRAKMNNAQNAVLALEDCMELIECTYEI